MTSFAVLVLVGRGTDPAQLGTYAIAVSILVLLLAVQEAIVTRPYAIHLARPLGKPAEDAFGSLALSVMLCFAASSGAGAVALILPRFDAYHELVEIAWALAVTIPFVLLREFARRFAFAHLKIGVALIVDVTTAVLTIIAVGWLGWAGRLSVATALVAMGASCGLSTFAWLYLARAEFAFDLRQLASTFRRSWGPGKWFLSGQIAIQAQGYMVPWLALVFAGASTTGIYTACASVVAFANPVIIGISNVLTPKFVHTLKMEGVQALKRRVACDALFLAAIMSAFCVVIFAFGDGIMYLLYQGSAYVGNGPILAVLALAALAATIGIPASLALAATECARSLAFVMTSTAILTVLLVSVLLPRWGLLGASYGILAAELVGALGRWGAFLLLVAADSRQPAGDGFRRIRANQKFLPERWIRNW